MQDTTAPAPPEPEAATPTDPAATPTNTASPPPRRRLGDALGQPGQFTSALAIGVVMLLVGGTGILGFRLGAQRSPDAPGELANVQLLFDRITDDAVDEASTEELVDGAIEGLLGTLDDPYAVYYDPERYDQLTADLDGEFVGVGITIEEQADGVFITGVLPGSPAEEQGVMAGERITSVDGTTITPETTSGEVVELIAGPAGTVREIGLAGGDAGARTVTVELRRLELPQVAARLLDSGHGYLAVTQFSREVAEQLTTEITALQGQGARGFVLDLRGNPGGLLDEAVDVVSLFAEEGVAVRVESRAGTRELEVSGDTVAPDAPLVVLVDGNSASASEIVAGALQDLGRAEVVGSRTFGKGTVQTIQDLALGAGVKFTTARYFTPSGDSIEGVGVTPDSTVTGDAEAVLARAVEVLDGAVAAEPATTPPSDGS